LLFCASFALAANAMLPHPSVPLLFVLAGLMSAISGFHSPALESLTPRLVNTADLPAVSALAALRGSTAAIAGPAVAGLCIAHFGMPFTFGIDAATYALSLVALWSIRSMPAAPDAAPPSFGAIREAFSYALSRPELIGTYVVDILAVTFAMPVAVFPALSEQWGGASAAGYLYSAMSVGSLVITLFSRWTGGVTRHGAAVVLAAMLWGAAIIGVGYSNSLAMAVVFLALAGAADTVSGLFRLTIWNQTIPTQIRGRMAAIEQLSYMTGPLLGNARAGFMAERFGLMQAITWGGFACVAGVAACVPLLPAFWRYRRTEAAAAE
jgi:MFS family permease